MSVKYEWNSIVKIMSENAKIKFVNESEIAGVVSEKAALLPKMSSQQLRWNRSTAKGLLTKKNKIESLLNKLQHASDVELKTLELETSLESLKKAHVLYHDTLSEDENIDESADYVRFEELKVEDLFSRLEKRRNCFLNRILSRTICLLNMLSYNRAIQSAIP